MKTSSSLALVLIMAGTALPAFSEEFTDPADIAKLDREIQTLLHSASADLKDYRQISTISVNHPGIDLMHAHPLPPQNGKPSIKTLTHGIDFFRGVGETYRVEYSPSITTHEDGQNPQLFLLEPGSIRFWDQTGAQSGYEFPLSPASGIPQGPIVARSGKSKYKGVGIFFESDYGPGFIYDNVDHDEKFQTEALSHASSAARTESADSTTFDFKGDSIELGKFEYVFEFKQLGKLKLPKSFDFFLPAKGDSSRKWEYVEQDGHWVPARRTWILYSNTSDDVTDGTATLTFSNHRPLLTDDELKSDRPLTPEMAALFQKAVGLPEDKTKTIAKSDSVPNGSLARD